MKDDIQNSHRLKRFHSETQEFNLSAKHKYKRDRAVLRLHINTQGYVSSMWRSVLSRKGEEYSNPLICFMRQKPGYDPAVQACG